MSRKQGKDNYLDGEEDSDAPEKGGNGGGRPTHTGENSSLSKVRFDGLSFCMILFPLDCHLLGKSSPKSMKGTGPSPHAYPKVIRIQEITGTRLKL